MNYPGIIVNTEYHHTTALSLYVSLEKINKKPVFFYCCDKDRFKFQHMCGEMGLRLTDKQPDVSFVVTASEKETGLCPGLSGFNRDKLIFVHHRPLTDCKLDKKHMHIANGIYEKIFSNNFFYQCEMPQQFLNNHREDKIAVIARFNENKINTKFILNNIQHSMEFVGMGSKAFVEKNNLNNSFYDFCDNLAFYKNLNRFKFFLIPYSLEQNNDYFSKKISETVTLSIAYKIPIIAEKSFLEFHNIQGISIDNKEAYNYNMLLNYLEQYQNKARNHNKEVLSLYLNNL